MLKRTLLALAVGGSALGLASQKASAMQLSAGLYVATPPVYVEVGPRPGPDYVWVPEFRRWEYRPRYYFRDRDAYRFYRDRDFYRDRERHEYFEHRRDRDDRRSDRDRR